MHTRAARAQSLSSHPLAYVRQYLQPAKNRASLILLVVLGLTPCILAASSCATQPPSSLSAVQNQLDPAKLETASRTNINTAGTAELESLPGVGPVIAERIIAHREQYGPFRRAEHLLMVRGISDHKFRELRLLIAVE